MPRHPWNCDASSALQRTPSGSARSKCKCMPIGFSGPHAKQFPSSNGMSPDAVMSSPDFQSIRQVSGKVAFVNLVLHFVDGIRITYPLHASRFRLVKDERRFRIEVARLPHAAYVDDVSQAGLEHEFAAVLHVLEADSAVGLLHPIFGDVRVADEH